MSTKKRSILENFYQFYAPIFLLLSFLAIIFIYLLLKNITVSIFAGIVLLIFMFRISPIGFLFFYIPEKLVSLESLFFFSAVFSVMFLSYLLRDAGIAESLVSLVRKSFPGLASFIILPASIGLFPMPGGALFSAPMVEKADAASSISPGRKAAINYWFRHIWEFWFPLYPGVLLAANLSGMSIWDFGRQNIVFTFISVFAGSLFLLLPVRKSIKPAVSSMLKETNKLKLPFLEIIIIITTYSTGYLISPPFPGRGYAFLLLGTIVSALILIIRSKIRFSNIKSILKFKKLWSFMLIVLLIKIYGFVLAVPTREGSIMQLISEQFLATGISPYLLIIILPLISGLVMGIAVGFVGISFPLVLGIIASLPGDRIDAYIMLAYISGYIGMMLSPLHICFIVSSEYFSSSLIKNLRYLIGPAAVILISAIAFAMV
ncbi:DUF401 family protein [Spirochaetia bacterium 38H-sp]|uniref:DUF401 family protein n=1 Tax=Rarispira pelagica TaxID=3141764 RepID=A0ABU9UD48_9SPIR